MLIFNWNMFSVEFVSAKEYFHAFYDLPELSLSCFLVDQVS